MREASVFQLSALEMFSCAVHFKKKNLQHFMFWESKQIYLQP